MRSGLSRSAALASTRSLRVSPARAPTASLPWANAASCRLHRLTTAAGARQENLLERGVARFDDLTPERQHRVVKLLERSTVDDAPRAAAALHRQRGIEDRRLIEVLGESHPAPLVAVAHVVEAAAQRHATAMQHRHVIRHPLHFFE